MNPGLRDSLIAWFGDVTNGITDLFAKNVHVERICLKKSDGTEFCTTGDQLESMVNGNTGNSNPIVIPQIISSPDPVVSPTDPEPLIPDSETVITEPVIIDNSEPLPTDPIIPVITEPVVIDPVPVPTSDPVTSSESTPQ